MDLTILRTYTSDILHAIAQGLLVPDMILLILFAAYALFCIGSVLAEFFSERRHFKVAMPKFLAALMAAEEGDIPSVIEQSGLLKRQKVALLTVYDYRVLPGDALVALIKRLVNEEESRYDRISGRNSMAARVSPMLGLMGTLIPLGPGIQALGNADTAGLSASLLIAFDTTVAGLVVAAVCMVVGKIRNNWYANYMSALDSGMATMLQKIEDMRNEGKIAIEKPSDYAFIYEKSGASAKKGDDQKHKRSEKDSPAPQKTSGSPEASPRAAMRQDGTNNQPFGSAAQQGAPSAAPLPTIAPLPLSNQAGTAPVNQWGSQPTSPSYTGGLAAGQQDLTTGSTLYGQPGQPSTPPFATGALEPIKPLVANAPFEPVPDPAFISNLASPSPSETGAFPPVNFPGAPQPDNRRTSWGNPSAMPTQGAPAPQQTWGASSQPGYYDPNKLSSK